MCSSRILYGHIEVIDLSLVHRILLFATNYNYGAMKLHLYHILHESLT